MIQYLEIEGIKFVKLEESRHRNGVTQTDIDIKGFDAKTNDAVFHLNGYVETIESQVMGEMTRTSKKYDLIRDDRDVVISKLLEAKSSDDMDSIKNTNDTLEEISKVIGKAIQYLGKDSEKKDERWCQC